MCQNLKKNTFYLYLHKKSNKRWKSWKKPKSITSIDDTKYNSNFFTESRVITIRRNGHCKTHGHPRNVNEL